MTLPRAASPLRVLVCSPQSKAVMSVISALAGEGLEVSGTTSETEALAKFRSGACNLVLLNVSPSSPSAQSWTMVIVRTESKAVLAVPSPLLQSVFLLDDPLQKLSYAINQIKAGRESLDANSLSRLAGIVDIISTQEKGENLSASLLERMANLVSCRAWLIVREGQDLRERATVGAAANLAPLVNNISKWVLDKGQALSIDLPTGPGQFPEQMRQEMVKANVSSFALPLKAWGSLLGAAVYLREKSNPFTNSELQLASLLQPILAMTVYEERLLRQVQAEKATPAPSREYVDSREKEIRALNMMLQRQQTKLLDLEEQVQELNSRYISTLRAIVNASEVGDPAQPGLADNVANWMALLAKPLGVDPQGPVQAAYLHDLVMPKATTTASERVPGTLQQQVLRHPYLAEKIAELSGFPLEVRLGVKHHHENYDGSGYPDGLSGDSIPLISRMLRVVDALVNLSASSSNPISAAEALVKIRASAGREYDPSMVETLEQLITQGSGSKGTGDVSTVSHELRTPLTFLVGYSELLATQKDLPPDVREKAELIHQESIHMSRLVDDLLNVSRYEAGRVEFRWQKEDLRELITRAITKAKTKTQKHQLETELPESAMLIRTDPDKLVQVLDNLLDNAIKYSPDGGKITVKAEASHNEALTRISDQGIGIPLDKRKQLFEKFYRVDSPLKDTVTGTGLGLHLCKLIVDAHGGRIWVDSVEGKGSTFSFALPLFTSA